MKRLIILSVCILVCGAVSAQKKKASRPNISVIPQKAGVSHKSAIGGYFTDMRKHPIKGLQAFIYLPDSTIGASGFTDSTGYYETNTILPGTYDLKLVFPNNGNSMMITGVPVVRGTITEISFFKTTAPAADTVLPYSAIEPAPIEKPKAKSKK